MAPNRLLLSDSHWFVTGHFKYHKKKLNKNYKQKSLNMMDYFWSMLCGIFQRCLRVVGPQLAL